VGVGERGSSAARPPPAVRGPWRPAVTAAPAAGSAAAARSAPDASGRHAVVDDLLRDRAVLVVSAWPAVDEAGHLRFDEHAAVVDVGLDALQRRLDTARGEAGQPAPDRPVRVGDVLWLDAATAPDPRGGDRSVPDAEVATWRPLDVTRAARAGARAAHLTAADPSQVDHPTPVPAVDPTTSAPAITSAPALDDPDAPRSEPPPDAVPPAV
jgi:hypothetical protein